MKKYKVIILVIFFLAFIILAPTLGRYASKQIKEYYLNSKNFYFNSDKLTENGVTYQVENWSGVDSYDVTFNMDSYKNNNVYATSDINYDINYTCSNNVTCSITKTTGVILANRHTDSFVVTVTPIRPLDDDDVAWIEVEATSTVPYTKTLTGRFNIVVGKMGLSYEIYDKVGQTFFETSITNTLDYYIVRTPFDGYTLNQKIDMNTYLNLDSAKKSNCASSIVTINFPVPTVLLDVTATEYLNSLSYQIQNIDGHDYIKSLTFKVDAMSSNKIKFYKANALENYSYPFGESIIEVIFN